MKVVIYLCVIKELLFVPGHAAPLASPPPAHFYLIRQSARHRYFLFPFLYEVYSGSDPW